MKINRIIFWQPCVSPHTSDLIEEIARYDTSVEVISCPHENLLNNRKELGWSADKSNCYAEYVAPTDDIIQKLIKTDPENSLHVLCGIRNIQTIENAIAVIKRVKTHFAILQEPRVREGIAGEIRYLQSWLTEGWFRKKCAFVLGIGRNGPRWFTSTGYRSSKVFPFAYYIHPHQSGISNSYENTRDQINIGYVGRLIEMKGGADIIESLSFLPDTVSLHFAGKGADEEKFRAMAASTHRDVTFHGVIDNNAIGSFIQNLDILILPSRSESDGWGVVVSEALMQGTAVIATPAVGASILLDNPLNGKMVPVRNPNAIAEAVESLEDNNAFAVGTRQKRQELALQTLTAEAGAKYFWNVVKHTINGETRPLPFYQIAESKV